MPRTRTQCPSPNAFPAHTALAMTIRSCPPYLRRLDPRPPDLKPDHPFQGEPEPARQPQRLPCTSSNAHLFSPNGVRNDYGAHKTRGVITAGYGLRVPRLVLMRPEILHTHTRAPAPQAKQLHPTERAAAKLQRRCAPPAALALRARTGSKEERTAPSSESAAE